MQKIKTTVTLQIILVAFVFLIYGVTNLNARSNDTVETLVAFYNANQRTVAEKKDAQISSKQLCDERDAMLSATAIDLKEVFSGIATCELKNKAEHVWFFLGVASMLGLACTTKILFMLADDTSEQKLAQIPLVTPDKLTSGTKSARKGAAVSSSAPKSK